MQVAKWGNSLAVRLPAGLVKELELQVGDEIQIKQVVRGNQKVREWALEKAPSKSELLMAIRRLRVPASDNFVFDRDETNQR